MGGVRLQCQRDLCHCSSGLLLWLSPGWTAWVSPAERGWARFLAPGQDGPCLSSQTCKTRWPRANWVLGVVTGML